MRKRNVIAVASLAIWIGLAILAVIARGHHPERWLGWLFGRNGLLDQLGLGQNSQMLVIGIVGLALIVGLKKWFGWILENLPYLGAKPPAQNPDETSDSN